MTSLVAIKRLGFAVVGFPEVSTSILIYCFLSLILVVATTGICTWLIVLLRRHRDESKRTASEMSRNLPQLRDGIEKIIKNVSQVSDPRSKEDERKLVAEMGDLKKHVLTLTQLLGTSAKLEKQRTSASSSALTRTIARTQETREARFLPVEASVSPFDNGISSEVTKSREELQKLAECISELRILLDNQRQHTGQLEALRGHELLSQECHELRNRLQRTDTVEKQCRDLESSIAAEKEKQRLLETLVKEKDHERDGLAQQIDRYRGQRNEDKARRRELEDELSRLRKENENVAATAASLTSESARFRSLYETYQGKWNGLWLKPFTDNGELCEWRERLQSPTPGSALVLNCVHRCKILLESDDERQAARAFHELGEALYRLMAELGERDSRAAETADRWARALEKELNGRFFFQVARVGDAKDLIWMAAPPDPAPVKQVYGWCVSNSRRQPIHKAAVK